MSNQVFGPYIATVWQQGVTPANATNLNHLENGPIYSLHGYNADLVSPYVDHGIVCTRDGTNLKQLNVTAGRAYVTVIDSSGLSSIALIATTSSTASQFLTATPSTTYYLFLLKDGTWQWGTTSTGPTNSLAICSATTDGSGNINVVTDARQLGTTLFPNAEGGGPLAGGVLSAHATSGFGVAWPAAWTTIAPITITRAGTYLVSVNLQSDCVNAAQIALSAAVNGTGVAGQGTAQMDVVAGKTFTLNWTHVATCAAGDTLAAMYINFGGASTHSGFANFFVTAFRASN